MRRQADPIRGLVHRQAAGKATVMATLDPKAATAKLLDSFNTATNRRALLKGAAGSALAATGAGALLIGSGTNSVSAQVAPNPKIVTILSVARTAEQLAVTFYSNGIANAARMGLGTEAVGYLRAALIEEQIHQLFFAANGGQSVADTFSFPGGAATFTDLRTFIQTQQQLEGVFDSAFLAAVKEFAQLGAARLAQIAAQVACIESEHRVLGRIIGGLTPADNWAYAPVLLNSVADAPALVTQAGYLSPTAGNSYQYRQVDTTAPDIQFQTPFTVAAD